MGFPGTNTSTKEDPIPIITVEVTNAEMATLKTTYLSNSDKKPYVVCNVQDANNKVYFMWTGTDWLSLAVQGGGGNTDRLFSVDFSLDGIYSNGTSWAAIPIQVMIAEILDIGAFTKVEAKICVSYAVGASGGEVRLYNYTDSAVVPGTTLALPSGTWVYESSAYFDITSVQGKALRLETRKISGTGSLSVEGAKLILKFS